MKNIINYARSFKEQGYKPAKIINLLPRIIILFCLLLVSCGIDPLTGEESPDKNKVVLAFTKRIGDSRTFISIEEKSGKNKKIIMKLKKVTSVSFEWVNNNELKIYLPDKSLMESSDLTYMDVKIYAVEKRN